MSKNGPNHILNELYIMLVKTIILKLKENFRWITDFVICSKLVKLSVNDSNFPAFNFYNSIFQ